MKLRERLFGRKVWKVLWHGHSAWAIGSAAVRYRLFWPVSAPAHLAKQGYHLTCFSSLRAARSFRNWGDSVYEARAWGVIESNSLPPMCNLPSLRRDKVEMSPRDQTWPTGTLMAKRIMLTRKVETHGS